MAGNRKQRMNKASRSEAYSKYYSHGSQAAKIEAARDKVSLKYYGRRVLKEEKNKRRSSYKRLFCVIIICLCSIATVFARSTVSDYQLENKRLKTVLEEEQYKTGTILMQSTERIDMAYVEEVATTRLNMSKPQAYQIVYIEVPKSDYTVLHNYTPTEENEGVDIKALLKMILPK